jgi:hypothetical protein
MGKNPNRAGSPRNAAALRRWREEQESDTQEVDEERVGKVSNAKDLPVTPQNGGKR